MSSGIFFSPYDERQRKGKQTYSSPAATKARVSVIAERQILYASNIATELLVLMLAAEKSVRVVFGYSLEVSGCAAGVGDLVHKCEGWWCGMRVSRCSARLSELKAV